MARIAHLSDIHFGRIAFPKIVDALGAEVNEAPTDLVVLSGDLTQRARRREFRRAAAMIDAFAAPTLVVPGNHDVYAWWYPLQRLFRPLKRYRRYIADDLTPTFEQAGLAVLGINSAHGRTIKGGRIRGREREAIASFFARQDASVFKVLVVHHHLMKIQALAPHDVVRKARRTLEVASDVGVDLVLCGHLHISHIEPLEIVPGRHRLVVASAGTATSNRGRGPMSQTNFYNVIDVGPDAFTVEERRYEPDLDQFVTDSSTRFERYPVGQDQ